MSHDTSANADAALSKRKPLTGVEQFINDFFVAALAQDRKRRFAKLEPPKPERRYDSWQKRQFDGLVEWLTRKYGDPIGPFLARRLASKLMGCDCVDNLRVCDLGIPSEVEEHRRARDTGCCGFCDFEIEHYATGRRFRLGFNYGH